MKSGILHTLKFDLHTLSCHFWLNLWLVANVSSQFHRLVNTRLAVGSRQMATNKSSPYLQIRHNLSVLLRADWNWLQLIVIAFNWDISPNWSLYFEKLIFPYLGS